MLRIRHLLRLKVPLSLTDQHSKYAANACQSMRFMSSNNEEDHTINTCDVVQGPSLLRTPVHRPSPSLLFLPGLRSIPMWTSLSNEGVNRVAYQDPTVSQVVDYLEGNVDRIRDEYLEVASSVKSDYLVNDHSKLHEGEWDWHSYMNKGSVQGHFANHFRETATILQKLRKDHILFEGTPFGFCFFSSLHGNSRIKAHSSPINLRLRIHLPLVVPIGTVSAGSNELKCGIRVGSVVKPWTQDKALVLDDAYDHEVWNETDETRVLLLVDIWHPDVTMAERQEIVGMFQQAKGEGLWK